MIKYTPLQYLQIDIANHYGWDGLQFEDRIKWVEQHDTDLESYTLNFAEDKFRYAAAVIAYRDVQENKSIGYLVGLDAAASGPAILGALTGCEVTAANTGIINQYRKDIYGICTSIMSRMLDAEIEVTRKEVKGALMPSYYGSKAQPVEVFGKDTPEHIAFLTAAKEVAPGADALKSILLKSWQTFELTHSWTMPDGFEVRLPILQTMETKLEVDELEHTSIKMLYEDNIGTEMGLSLVANFTHACDSLMVREVGRRCNYNAEHLMNMENNLTIYLNDNPTHKYVYEPVIEELWRKSGFLSLVGIEYVNKESVVDFGHDYLHALLNLISDTLRKPSFDILFIHDEYLCHPNYMNHTRQTVIDVLAEMADSDMASDILTQITGIPTAAPMLSAGLGDAIRESEYVIS